MKKYLFICTIVSGAMWTSCDPLEENFQLPESAFETESPAFATGDENARKYGDITLKRGSKIYELTLQAYKELMDGEKINEAVLTIRKAGGDEQYFMKAMLQSSMRLFDETVIKNGGFLGKDVRSHYLAMMDAGFDIDFDTDRRAAVDYFLKIPDLPGDTEEFVIVEDVRNPEASIYISSRQLVELAKFVDIAPRYLDDPVAMDQALNELEITSGINQTATGLLLPAVQQIREAANSSGFSGGVRVAVGDVTGDYGLDPEILAGDFLRFGGYGSIQALISENSSGSGDVDARDYILWHRAKFEMEMWLLWNEYWKKYAYLADGR